MEQPGDFFTFWHKRQIISGDGAGEQDQGKVNHNADANGQNGSQRVPSAGELGAAGEDAGADQQLFRQPVHRPDNDAHDGGRQARLQESTDIAQGTGEGKFDDTQIQQGDHAEAGDGAHRAALDVDVRITSQDIDDDNFHHTADDGGNHGDGDHAVRLKNGVAHQHDTHADGGDGQHGEHLTGQNHIGGGIEQEDNRLAQNAQTYAGGENEQSGGAQGGFADFGTLLIVLHRPGGGDGGDDAGSDGDHKGGGQVVQGEGLVINALEHTGLVLGKAGTGLETTEDDAGIQQIGQGHDGGTQGDGNGQLQQRDQNLLSGIGGIGVAGEGGAVAAVAHQNIGGSHGTAHTDADDRAGGGDRFVQTTGDHNGGQRQADDQLTQGLNDLGNGGGGHERMTLEVAAQGRQGTDEEHGGSQSQNTVITVAVVHQIGELPGENQHNEHGNHAQGTEGNQCDAEDLVDLVAPAQSIGLRHHLGQSYRQAAGGDDDEQGVDIVSGVEVREGGLADDVAQRDLKQGADQLDDDNAYGENGGTAKE